MAKSVTEILEAISVLRGAVESTLSDDDLAVMGEQMPTYTLRREALDTLKNACLWRCTVQVNLSVGEDEGNDDDNTVFINGKRIANVVTEDGDSWCYALTIGIRTAITLGVGLAVNVAYISIDDNNLGAQGLFFINEDVLAKSEKHAEEYATVMVEGLID
ncbi:MAG: hypothetical protein IPI29_08480 [Ignavibacteria bacterium]|nr:hypothetical protein [Ignavibacteria bacterium]